MLRNLLDALQPAAKGLRHITLMQGTKAYGNRVRPLSLEMIRRLSAGLELPADLLIAGYEST